MPPLARFLDISEELRSCIGTVEEAVITDAGHMVYRERPETVAAIIEAYRRGS